MSTIRRRRLFPLVTVLVLILPLVFVLSPPVSAATVSVCASGCDYTSIQAAVTGETYPASVNVYPGAYDESVDLYKASGGDVTVVAVNAAGMPTPGVATVNGGANPAFHTSLEHSGNITINGFVASSNDDHAITLDVNSDIVIRNVTASDNDEDGIHISGAGGDVTIEDCTANDNDSDGVWVDFTDGNLTIRRCTATGNVDRNLHGKHVGGDVTINNCTADNSQDSEGIDVYCVAGNVTIENCTASENHQEGIGVYAIGSYCEYFDAALRSGEWEQSERADHEHVASTGQPVNPSANGGDVTIKNCTASDNGAPGPGGDGISIIRASGDVAISNCAAKGNFDHGMVCDGIDGGVEVSACILQDNGYHGIVGWWATEPDSVLVNGCIICGNPYGGMEMSYDQGYEATAAATDADATGNWWGCAGGPDAAGCDTVSADGGSVIYDPWIKAISASASVDPVKAGQPTVVTFQFSGGPPAVYLGQGPGSLIDLAPFTVSTDNGTLNGAGASIGAFVNAPDGTLQVTLVPSKGGTATVTVVGPCGLEEQIVLGVLAAEFVPEPGSVLLLASGLAGLAGYAGLRRRMK